MIRFLKVIFVLAAIGTMSLFGVRAAAAGADELATEASVDESISVIFYDGDELYYEANIESGGAPDLPEPPSREGYSFDGWRIGTASGEKYGAGTPLLTHTALYASYVLLPPSFEISSLSFSYDGTSHRLSFTDISHPLLDEGFIFYEWYKDGEPIDNFGDYVSVRDVCDSGSYVCNLTFSVGGEVAVASTLPVGVEVLKREIQLPTIPQQTYTADPIFPEIFDTGAYTVVRKSYTEAGEYRIEITLRDSENYCFSGTDDSTVTVPFVILRAQNYWTDQPFISDCYNTVPPSPTATPRFGSVSYMYSPIGRDEYTSIIPTLPGEYLMCAVVEETENYTALISSPVKFRIIEEKITGISIKKPAARLEYVAFEEFVPDGIEVAVSYNSGRVELVGAEELEFSYLRGDTFLFGDRGIRVLYRDFSVVQYTEVSRADYDTSGVTFSDINKTYNGQYQSAEYVGVLPVGLDGIPLIGTVRGGGTDAGEYEIILEFSTSSTNYNTPLPLVATLTLLPAVCEIEWTGLSFTYDSTAKVPRAFFVDVFGDRVELVVSGSRVSAGVYTASAATDDANYSFSNPNVEFEIERASYDVTGVNWCGGGLTYDGKEHEVYLDGLPLGVTVNGYVNNKATDAGTYVARAVFIYDKENYKEPDIPEYEWQILKATYNGDGISFTDSTAVYDGKAHFPSCNGKMPTGHDGISLEYSFSEGAVHVTDIPVEVTVTFTTKSKNYTAPEPIVCYVKIIPKVITVDWILSDFCYTGTPQAPVATSDECSITVSGAGISAGEHTAVAVPKTNDYTISNPTCTYVIAKAKNAWKEQLSIKDVFFGQAPSPLATALGGEVEYLYYSDAECKSQLTNRPSGVGVYYVVARTVGDGNYLSISSEPLKFEIIAIVPVSLEITLLNKELRAFEVPSFAAALLNNDGTRTPIFSNDIAVRYQNGDSLLFGDTEIAFGYSGFNVTIEVNVSKQCYDMSGIRWENILQIYDGTPKSPVLTGLPDGVTVKEYVGAQVVDAGQYVVGVTLDYDSENYVAPECASVTFTVRKQTVSAPVIAPKVYNGTGLIPTTTESPLYNAEPFAPQSLAGIYSVVFTLTDPKNYTFADGADTISVPFVISRREIEVTVSDVELRLFDNDISPSFSITAGALIAGDLLTPVYRVDGDKIYADFDSPNYKITVIPGDVRDVGLFSSANIDALLFILFLLFGILLIVAVILYTGRGSRYVLRVRETGARPPRSAPWAGDVVAGLPPASTRDGDAPASNDASTEAPQAIDRAPTDAEQTPNRAPAEPEETPCEGGGVSTQRADELITDGLARDLIRRDADVVTDGHRHGIVNIDTLSRSFSAGDRVDINALKSHSLIPYDTGYIKVLARGILDKPLDVYANDFSLCAVKMIALMGGRAIKVNTASVKKRGKKR